MSTIPHTYAMWGQMGDSPPSSTDTILFQGVQSNFAQVVGDVISSRIALNSKRQALKDQIKQVMDSHDEIVASFKNAASDKYPELAGHSANQIAQVLQSLSPDHPLWAIYQSYGQGLADAENQIATLAQQYYDNFTQEQDLASAQATLCLNYDNYLDSNGMTDKPHSVDILASLPDPKEINAQVDVDTFTQLSLLDLVSPDVEYMIASSLAQQDGGDVEASCLNLPTDSNTVFDAGESDYQIEDQALVDQDPGAAPPVNPMWASPARLFDDGSNNVASSDFALDENGQPIEDLLGVPASQNLNPDGTPAAIHPMYLLVALGALAYVILGS